MDTPRSRGRRRLDPATRKGRAGAAAAYAAGDKHRPVSRILYLPADLVETMRTYRGEQSITNTTLMLRALNAQWRHIDDLVRAANDAPVGEGDLFAETRPAADHPRRQVEVTPTGAQLEIIDDLVATTTARDRSHLVALTVRAFLEDNLS